MKLGIQEKKYLNLLRKSKLNEILADSLCSFCENKTECKVSNTHDGLYLEHL